MAGSITSTAGFKSHPSTQTTQCIVMRVARSPQRQHASLSVTPAGRRTELTVCLNVGHTRPGPYPVVPTLLHGV